MYFIYLFYIVVCCYIKIVCANQLYNPISEFMVQMGYLQTGSIMCTEVINNPNTINGVKQEIDQLMQIANSIAGVKINVGSDISKQMNGIYKYCKNNPNSPLAMAFLEVVMGGVNKFLHGGYANTGLANGHSNIYSNKLLANDNYNVNNTNNQQNGTVNYSQQPEGYYNKTGNNNRKTFKQNGVGIINY